LSLHPLSTFQTTPPLQRTVPELVDTIPTSGTLTSTQPLPVAPHRPLPTTTAYYWRSINLLLSISAASRFTSSDTSVALASNDVLLKSGAMDRQNQPRHRKSEQLDTDYDRNNSRALAGVKRLYNPHRDDSQNFHQQQLLRNEQNRQKGTNPPIPDYPRLVPIVPRTSIEPVNESDKRERAAHDPLPSAEPYENEEQLRIILQPETRPISSDQLIAEVKGIYAGLLMVEAKCCEVDAKQHQQALVQDDRKSSLTNEQWYVSS
jgi:hypothetical protein